jgi:hypothetical protein
MTTPDPHAAERPSDRLRATLPFIRRDHNSHLPDLLDEVLAEIDGLRRRDANLVAERDMEAASYRILADAVSDGLATDDDDDDWAECDILVRVVERAAGWPRTAAPAPGSSVVVSVGVDGTTSTHQLEQVGIGYQCPPNEWDDEVVTVITPREQISDGEWPVYRLVAVPVRDPQEPA